MRRWNWEFLWWLVLCSRTACGTTPLPTPLPSASPSPLPSTLPTPLPTWLPTPLPTVLPSVLPTALPTPLPTFGCKLGEYTDSNGTCYACPSGRYTNFTHHQSFTHLLKLGLSACRLCVPGTHIVDDGIDRTQHDSDMDCIICGAGRYQDMPGQASCRECPIGTFIHDNGTDITFHDDHLDIECRTCPSGTYQNANASGSCISCPAGTHLNWTNASSRTFHDSPGDCRDCPPAKEAPSSGLATCSWCLAGTFQPKSGEPTCDICPWGTYKSQEGGTSADDCASCPSGTFLADNATNATKHSSSDWCRSCGAGRYAEDTGSHKCTRCIAGKYSLETGQTDESTCIVCGVGKWTATEGTSYDCNWCPSGTYLSDLGTDAKLHDEQSDCSGCAAGRFSLSEDRSSCLTCQPGTFANLSKEDCYNCSTGYYSPTGLQCIPCGAGDHTGRQQGADSCTACESGKYSTDLSSSCSEGLER